MRDVQPVKPVGIDPLAAELLDEMVHQPAARHVVLGGYFALKHYCDYRATHDIDAWWDETAGAREQAAARQVLSQALSTVAQRRGLTVAQRRFGDTESWELCRDRQKVFSFQISVRTVRLAPYLPSPWPPVQIESLPDNVGSKMNALVQRGAPRDFADVRQLVESGLVNAADCWDAWARKNPDLDPRDARMEVARHLQELEKRRPLASITDAEQRQRAAAVRAWFQKEFLRHEAT